MSEQIPQDPERQEGEGGVEGAIEDLEARDEDAEQVSGGGEYHEVKITKVSDR
jgi:hypothetical protein